MRMIMIVDTQLFLIIFESPLSLRISCFFSGGNRCASIDPRIIALFTLPLPSSTSPQSTGSGNRVCVEAHQYLQLPQTNYPGQCQNRRAIQTHSAYFIGVLEQHTAQGVPSITTIVVLLLLLQMTG